MVTPQSGFVKKLLLTILCVFGCFILNAQDDALSTDRPDQTEASSTVGKGVLQIETGVVFSKHEVEFFSGHTENTNDFATTLFRYGILDNMEFRIASAFTDYELTRDTRKSGLQPLTVGTKIAICSEQGWRPEVAFIGHLTLPWVGDENLRPEFVAPDFRFSLSHTLSERFSLGYNIGMEWDGDNPKGAFIYTIALGASLFGPVSAFAEIFGDEKLDWTHNADFGITILLNPDLQFDASYGFPISGEETHFVNAGVSARFGN